MADVADTLSFARTQSQTDSNGLTDANGLLWANEALVDFRRRLVSKGVDASQLQESYRDGTAGTGTYLYPTNMFWLKAIELNYGDTSEQNYVPATQIDVSNIPANRSFSWLRVNAATQSPFFDDRGDWFEVFPTPTAANNVSQLMRIFYYLEPTEYASTSSQIVYPESLDYRSLSWRIAANYKYALGKIDEGDAFMAKYEQRVQQIIDTLSRGSQQPITATTIVDSGWEY